MFPPGIRSRCCELRLRIHVGGRAGLGGRGLTALGDRAGPVPRIHLQPRERAPERECQLRRAHGLDGMDNERTEDIHSAPPSGHFVAVDSQRPRRACGGGLLPPCSHHVSLYPRRSLSNYLYVCCRPRVPVSPSAFATIDMYFLGSALCILAELVFSSFTPRFPVCARSVRQGTEIVLCESVYPYICCAFRV